LNNTDIVTQENVALTAVLGVATPGSVRTYWERKLDPMGIGCDGCPSDEPASGPEVVPPFCAALLFPLLDEPDAEADGDVFA
jgi:hypothetical protein